MSNHDWLQVVPEAAVKAEGNFGWSSIQTVWKYVHDISQNCWSIENKKLYVNTQRRQKIRQFSVTQYNLVLLKCGALKTYFFCQKDTGQEISLTAIPCY